ncbi:MAG: TPM domain-containing protein, partial [Erythrobacter sp.]|nr:TPM domain-containing protein [Erythrobacter sp.]MDZ4276369.1 TPM domain-containing protein [Erythrobacter sp.]
AAQPQFPELTGRVVDNADILTPEAEARLTAKLEALETQSQRQLVIATIPDLQGYDISDYGYQLGRAWGLGDAERNDGALLLIAPNDRKVRIEVGYGLEGYLTDALSALIIQNQILPAFRDGDFPGGIEAGTDAIITQLQLPPEEAAQIAADAGKKRAGDGGFPVGVLIWLAFMVFFFILPIMSGRRRRRKYRSKGAGPWGAREGSLGRDMGDTARDIILWEVGSAILRGALSGGDDDGWGGGGFGGGFGGGGGFSGGGGSFGGGGASGGW